MRANPHSEVWVHLFARCSAITSCPECYRVSYVMLCMSTKRMSRICDLTYIREPAEATIKYPPLFHLASLIKLNMHWMARFGCDPSRSTPLKRPAPPYRGAI